VTNQTLPASFRDELSKILGSKGVVSDPQALSFHHTDLQGRTLGRAIAVVRPANTSEVSTVVKLCNVHSVKIVPQGGLTGLMSASIPVQQDQEIVVSLARMNHIENVNRESRTVAVEAGALLQTVQQLALDHDLVFPLNIGSQGSCMIGGVLSTNAGGAQVLRYGNARAMVLGIEVVLPDGQVWDGMRALAKDNTGYSLKDLFVGAEGTLGIITKAVLKLFPKPIDVATAWIAVPNPETAISLLRHAQVASNEKVSSCELTHGLNVEGILTHMHGFQRPINDQHDWHMLMEWSSSQHSTSTDTISMAQHMEAFLIGALERGQAIDATIAQSDAQARNMWGIRDAHNEVSRRYVNPSCSFDISVSIDKIPAFIEVCNSSCKNAVPGIRPRPFGHIGDGNLHYSFTAPAHVTDKADFVPMVRILDRIVHDLVVAAGGSISAEHGIGVIKLTELEHYRSTTELDIMRKIKIALDPKGLMNPGKVIRTDLSQPSMEILPIS
jgi:FAD/FMN-containing dehydrogenase